MYQVKQIHLLLWIQILQFWLLIQLSTIQKQPPGVFYKKKMFLEKVFPKNGLGQLLCSEPSAPVSAKKDTAVDLIL